MALSIICVAGRDSWRINPVNRFPTRQSSPKDLFRLRLALMANRQRTKQLPPVHTVRRKSPSRAERRTWMLENEEKTCVWCRREFDERLIRPTTEHVVPKIKGGPSWIENEVMACRRCNGLRGHQTPGDWIDRCRERGWEPNVPLVLNRLESLQEAISQRGGQRRARPYIRAQIRRLQNRIDP